jgi:glyoxylase-like metal-dependent hydrolase (beta-lactamase superfamily II)
VTRITTLGALILAGGLSIAVAAEQGQQPPPKPPSVEGLTVEKVKDNLFVIRGADSGGNTAVFVTERGVTLVDTKSPGWGTPLLAKVKTVTDKPVTMVINTHTHYDHVSGNVEMPANIDIVTHENTSALMREMNPVAGIGTTPNVFKDLPGNKGMPTRTFSDKTTIGSGADQIDLYHFGPAHTGGDAFVAFPALRIMHVGDTFPSKSLPIMDGSNGGSGVEYANTIRKAVKGVPNIDAIINGHTPAQTTPADMLQFADFVSDFVAYVQAGKKAGKAAEQVAKEWATPAKYTGYANPPAMARLQAYVNLIYQETK